MKAITDQKIFEEFTTVSTDTSHGGSALYKPLLLLFMLGRYWNNSERLQLWRDLLPPYREFVKKFNNRKLGSESAAYPFWYLKDTSSSIWSLVNLETVDHWIKKAGKNDRPSPKGIMNSDALCGFTEPVYHRIINDKVFLLEIIFAVLRKYFSVNKTHLPLLHAIEIPSLSNEPISFEQKILASYRYSCSICKFPGISNETSLDLQIAYIKPFAEGGPLDKSENCITMCDKHSNLFEHGTIAISEEDTILVSKQFRDFGGKENLLAYRNKQASFPRGSIYRPDKDYLAWHRARIFKS